ncbi:type III pantothenate kinase [Fervidibacter sacchari]|uniref:Type III pantothenate kinase n=1 Tax=Candidatus Fervidibacter sacchari TaxID=1448929 RepID=A0ABT2EQD7_9BACT|nr:type III pantothenate kinase [Candidatus Fervidibacter sacchari]MCS3919661.1 type III pantothenate kinase [Candidatus Fervidibacter sacchari]WKU15379.1 type III pantothenate kinase [Candidatus Fervidibacter sacchari]
MKLLAFDIGNTNITMGLFDAEQTFPCPVSSLPCPSLLGTWRIRTEVGRTAEEHFGAVRDFLAWQNCQVSEVNAVALCSVVPPVTTSIVEMSERFFGVKPLIVTGALNLGICNAYRPPEAVGADRLVNAVAALHLYGTPCIVVDFGTATTFDAIDRSGTYLGGAIAPGITMAAEALFQRTAQLPRVALSSPKQAIGRSTVESIQSGLIFGYVGLVKELVARFKDELGEAKVIATGGLAHLIAPLTEVIDEVNPDLTLMGLAIVWQQQNSDCGRGLRKTISGQKSAKRR